jgi:hypothetical protein
MYSKQDLVAIQLEMLSRKNGHLRLPECVKDAHTMSEIWKPATLGLEDSKEAAPVPPPPGLVSPGELRLSKIEQLAQDIGLSEPFSKLQGDAFHYFDHSGKIQVRCCA